MPIYEYKCTKCGDEFEVMQKMSDSPKEDCEKCKGKLEKLISQSSFALKGTGWYQTDYAQKEKPAKKCDPVSEKCAGCPSSK